MDVKVEPAIPSREQLLHSLYEAAELEHNLMCTYLYAAYSLRSGVEEGLTQAEAPIVAGWRRTILDVAIEEMGHLTAVWNITSALGGTPRFGRTNFPLEPGYLPAGIVVKLAPFNDATLQHFIFLERPDGSTEPDGEGFMPVRHFKRSVAVRRLTPFALDYDTVGAFYAALSERLKLFAGHLGEDAAFCGDPNLQVSLGNTILQKIRPVRCLKTALEAFDAIVIEGEGAPEDSDRSHFKRFVSIRKQMPGMKAANPRFDPAHPAAVNPVLRRPPTPEGRVWIEHEEASATVDLANACYGLMLRLLGHAYSVPSPHPDKNRSVELATGLMRAVTYLGERAARLPAGPANPDCHAGLSFIALRDAAPLPPGAAARRFFIERFSELSEAARSLSANGDSRSRLACDHLSALAKQSAAEFSLAVPIAMAQTTPAAPIANATAPSRNSDKEAAAGTLEIVEGEALTLTFEANRCIHARFCVTGAPKVFLANVQGAWIKPDAMDVERLVEIAHACPSGAIRYERTDGRPQEAAPPVNLAAIREAGPYAFRGDLRIEGHQAACRATLCRCGASKNKPFCDGSHHDAGFTATGEPPTSAAEMLEVRDGPLAIHPEIDGPLQVRGNLEMTSGTGRVVARLTSARLCRCGASSTKPLCDGSHARVGFRSDQGGEQSKK